MDDSLHYNESLILSELERRFYLYLIGGDYEKLFYTFDAGQGNNDLDDEQLNMSRIRLEVEVSQQDRLQKARENYADPEYKGILDYMLKSRINNKLEKQDDLFASCPELRDLQPILKSFGEHQEFDQALLKDINQIPWLSAQIKRFSQNPEYQNLLGLRSKGDTNEILSKLGYQLFVWLLPRFISEVLHAKMHPSLRDLVGRLRQYGRFTSGAIAKLVVRANIQQKDKWMIYMLAGISVVPLFLIINMVNAEINSLIAQQKEALLQEEHVDKNKLDVLDNYVFSSDAMREFLCLEEILKPHILEDLGFEHFDPMPYLLGYADQDSPLANVFFQARAYALYRQLFKTGRIHPHETAIFLRKHKIDKTLLHQLNEFDLTSIATHINLFQSMLAFHQKG
ncbi:MAG: hypothetical protein Alis3KO_08210 [Aliiglaciecola sp.]